MSDRDPGRWLDRLVGACFGLLLGAMALYGAVQVISSVWLPLTIGVASVGGVALGIWLVVWRSRWRSW